jgi:hypothetical protein
MSAPTAPPTAAAQPILSKVPACVEFTFADGSTRFYSGQLLQEPTVH